MLHHPGPDPVELENGAEYKQVCFGLRQAGLAAPLQRPAALLAVINVGDVMSFETLDGPADASNVIRSQEQADVVGNRRIRLYPV